MHKHPPGKTELIGKLAHLEAILCRLSSDYAAATHKNVLIADCIEKAKVELRDAVKSLTESDLNNTLHLSNIAWLHINFGRRLMEAESIETLLGEGIFLELTKDQKWQHAKIETMLKRMDQMVLDLLNLVQKRVTS
jgi:hypothetical protein